MLSAAVIGAGSMGRNHLRVYANLEDVELVGVADPEESVLQKAIQPYRVRGYTDYRELLDREKPALVSVVVPTRSHAEVACEVIKRGVHVLVEKPLALTRADGLRMIESAARQRVKLTVGHIERFNPAIIEIKQRLERQELGRIFQIHTRRLSPFPGRIQDVGVILDLATHDIDIMRYLTGAEVERVYAEIERKAHKSCEDLLSGLLRFSNGVISVMDVNWLTPTYVRQLAVLGERGMYLVDYVTQDLYWYKNSHMTDELGSLGYFRDVWEGDMLKIRLHKKEPLRAELESFVAAVREDREPRVSGQDGLRAVELAHTLLESGQSHVPIYLQPPAETAHH